MNQKIKVFVVFLYLLGISACGSGQDVVEESHTNAQIESQAVLQVESQSETLTEVLPEAQEAASDEGYDESFSQNKHPLIEDVDWEAYGKILSDEDYAALQDYFPILKDGVEFIWTMDSFWSKDEVKYSVTLDEFHRVLVNELWEDAGYDPSELRLISIALCDMDRDGNEELILYLNEGNYLILKREDDVYYGTDKMYRAFVELQTNGIYCNASGHYYQMLFEEGEFREVLLGYMGWEQYYMGDVETTDEGVFQEWLDGILSEEVRYYKPKTKADS